MDLESGNPYDINGPHFNPEMYIQKVFKDCTLKQIMEKESEIIRDTQTLHSDMQTLVYENYNKFIAATDTIRKMKSDFKEMEAEMDLLAGNMESIASFSEQVSLTLQDTRQKLTQLSSVHSLLKKLQFLFRLPFTLKQNLEDGNYEEAVRNYNHAQKTLQLYQETPSFQGIQNESLVIIGSIKDRLSQQLHNKEATAKELGEAVELLLALGEPASSLCGQFLSHATYRQAEQLQALESHLNLMDQDIIEFVDMGSSEFLSDLCLVVATYNDMFINKAVGDLSCTENEAMYPLVEFVASAMERYLNMVQRRMDQEQQPGNDATILVRALDRFYRRLQAVCTLLPGKDFAKAGLAVVQQAGEKQSQAHLDALKAHFVELLSQVRQTLAAPRVTSSSEEEGRIGLISGGGGLAEMLTSLVAASVDKLKNSLRDLTLFLQPDLTFVLKPQFKSLFCRSSVREGFVVNFIRFLIETACGFCVGPERTPPTLLLLLSKMCLELETSSVHYMLSQADEMFQTEDHGKLTSKSELCQELHAAGQKLLDHYVRMQGLSISQMLRKSVETRDWLHTMEPQTVRAVMKRVVEDVSAIDTQVGTLYEEGSRQDRSSDSSRRTHSVSRHQARPNWSSYTPNQLDSSLVTNIQKLFSERIEIFASAEFSKVSILTGIIKISLKTLLECVRLRTFSRFGLQQIQVDTHYLQLYLWRFVADENLVHFLLDEILGSAVHRCLDPVLMEPSVVEMICERG